MSIQEALKQVEKLRIIQHIICLTCGFAAGIFASYLIDQGHTGWALIMFGITLTQLLTIITIDIKIWGI